MCTVPPEEGGVQGSERAGIEVRELTTYRCTISRSACSSPLIAAPRIPGDATRQPADA